MFFDTHEIEIASFAHENRLCQCWKFIIGAMQSMNILDMRTLLMSNVVCSLICVVVLAVLWRHNSRRFPATVFWLRSMAMQCTALLLIVLRGTIPDFASIIVSGGFVIGVIRQLHA